MLGASAVAWGCLVRSRRASETAEPEWETIEQQDERAAGDKRAQRALSELTWIYEVDPAKMPPGDLNYPASFFFPRDFAPTKPPISLVDDKRRVRHEFSADAPNELWLSDIPAADVSDPASKTLSG